MVIKLYMLFAIISLFISCVGIGKWFFKDAKKWYECYIIGFIFLSGSTQFLSVITAMADLKLYFLYIAYFIILLLGVVYFFVKFKVNFIFNLSFAGLIVFVIVMSIIFTTKGLSIGNFDSVYYLSMISEFAKNLRVGNILYDVGSVTNEIDAMYDGQGFYHLSSFFVYLYNQIAKCLNFYFNISANIYMWVMSINFYVLLYSFTITFIEKIKAKKYEIVIVLSLMLVFFANLYWNNTFSFFGNSYRTVLVTLLTLEIYLTLKAKELSLIQSIKICLIVSSVLSVSSSGLFITFFQVFSFLSLIIFMNKKLNVDKIGLKVLIITAPIILFGNFAAIYIVGTKLGIVVSIIFIVLCLLFDRIKSERLLDKVYIILKTLVIGVIVGVALLSVYNFTFEQFMHFFDIHATFDMVWSMMYFGDLKHFVVNIIFFISLIYYLIRNRKSHFSKYLIILLLFINPLSCIAIEKYFAGVVYYRVFEAIFNPCTYLILVFFLLENIHSLLRYVIIVCLTITFIYYGIDGAVNLYHESFEMGDDYDLTYKITNDEVDMINYIISNVIEDDRRYTIVTQLEALKGFVPNVNTNYTMRLDFKYSNYSTDNELIKIFMRRDYPGQGSFDTEPDFKNVCSVLDAYGADYVLISNDQFYIDDETQQLENYGYLVSKCEVDFLYGNANYLLYRLNK